MAYNYYFLIYLCTRTHCTRDLGVLHSLRERLKVVAPGFESNKKTQMDYFPANKFKRKPKTDEASLQSRCYRWFKNTYPEQYGRLWMQYNNPRSMQTGVFLKAQGMVSGVSDLAFLRNDGRMVFIELKTEKGRQSEEQKWWQSVVEANQARYYVVRTLEEFQVIITNNIKN